MKKIRKIMSVLFLTIMTIFCVSTQGFAESQNNITVVLPKNKVWATATTLNRSGNYNNVKTRCKSVYPTSGPDHFTKIKARITNTSGTLIMNNNYVTLTEGTVDVKIPIKDGYYNVTKVRFQYRGNKNDAAEAVVNCNAR